MPDVAMLSVGAEENEERAADLHAFDALASAGFQVTVCAKPKELFNLLRQGGYPIVIINVATDAEVDGFMLTSLLHSTFCFCRIVLFVGPSAEDRARGLDSGADVCLSGPMQPSELVAALNALYRRLADAAAEHAARLLPPILASNEGDIWILENRGWRLRAPNGVAIELTSVERTFITRLFDDGEKLLRRDQWHDKQQITDQMAGRKIRNIDVMVSRLRRKVGTIYTDFPLQVRRGVGYQFSEKCMIKDPGN
jgi:two-component system OmpR family response regulator